MKLINHNFFEGNFVTSIQISYQTTPNNLPNMTATNSLHETRRSHGSDRTPYRLERINSNIFSLRKKLSSYMYEPKTLTLYQKLDSLKFQLENLLQRNQELISKYYRTGMPQEEGARIEQQQIRSYKELELKVLEYIGMAKLHC